MEKVSGLAFDLANEGMPGRDETWMVPLKKLPATDLRNCGCYANASLVCGQSVTVVLWGVRLRSNPKEEELWESFNRTRSGKERPIRPGDLRYGIWVVDRWWLSKREGNFMSLADFKKHEPTELASALGLTLNEVFPIAYDISAFAVGPATIVRGKIFPATQ